MEPIRLDRASVLVLTMLMTAREHRAIELKRAEDAIAIYLNQRAREFNINVCEMEWNPELLGWVEKQDER